MAWVVQTILDILLFKLAFHTYEALSLKARLNSGKKTDEDFADNNQGGG